MRKSVIALVLLSIVSLLLTGCGGSDREGAGPQYHDPDRAKSKTIAKVGESEIKLFIIEEYNELYGNNFESADAEYEFKKAKLDSLIDMYLMVEAAYAQGLDKDPEIMKLVRDARPDFLRDQLFKEKILPHIQVSDEEAKEYYEKMKEELHIFNIFISDSAKADSLYKELQKGADFEAAARKYSDENEYALKGGDYGFHAFGQLSTDFQENVYPLKDNELKLFLGRNGWNIAKVVDRREIELMPYDEIKYSIKSRIQADKRRIIQTDYNKELRKKADVKINQETVEFIMDKIDALYPERIGGKPFRKNTFNPNDLAEYEQNMILATYNGGEVTLGDYLLGTATWQDARRPPFDDTENLKLAIFDLKLKQILLDEALALNLDEKSDFKDVMRFFKDQIMARKIQQVVAQEKAFVTDDEIISYYEANTAKYVIPRKVHLQEILINTEDEADRLHQKLDDGTDFGKLAGENTVRPGMRSKKGDLGFIAEYNFPSLYENSLSLRINQYSEPFPVGDKWSIVKLLEIQQAQRKDLQEVSSQIKSELEVEKREKGLEKWRAGLKEKYPAKVDYNLIWDTIDKSAYE